MPRKNNVIREGGLLPFKCRCQKVNSLAHSSFSTNIISVIQILFFSSTYKCHDNVILKCSFPEMWWSTVGIRIIMGFWSNFKQVFQVVCLPHGQFAYLLVGQWNRCVNVTCSLFCSYFKRHIFMTYFT